MMVLTEASEFEFPEYDTLAAVSAEDVRYGRVELLTPETAEFGANFPSFPRRETAAAVFPIDNPRRWITRRTVQLFRSSNMFYMPGFGALVTQDGQVLQESFEEARWYTPTKAKLPYVTSDADRQCFEPPELLRQIDAGFVCVPLGATVNYGHFILDCLPALMLCEHFLREKHLPILMPVLKSWQRRHIELLELALQIIELPESLVRCEVVYHTNIMNHFLHYLSPLANQVAERQIVNSRPSKTDGWDPPIPPVFGSRLFIEREHVPGRSFPGEMELGAALSRFGFTAIRPENLSVDDQICAFGRADMVVGATGAAFANILYCRPGSLIVEIMPEAAEGNVWVRNICDVRHCFWGHIVIPSRPADNIPIVEGVARPEVGLEYDPNYDVHEIIKLLKPFF